MRVSRRIMWLTLLVGAGILVMALAVWWAATRTSPVTVASPTFTPISEARIYYNPGECIKVTRPTYLRFGPGVDYPVMTNIPVRSQPPISILQTGQIGLTCSDPKQCNLRDEGWWWPVEVHWPDSGDVDQGWLWQSEFKTCR